MTSASELFHNRRSRTGRNDSELGFGSSFSFDRALPSTPVSNHHQHSRRRSRHHHQTSDGTRRSSSSRHHCHREHESVRLDHGASQFSTGNSSASGTSSSRTSRMQFARSDQLPGDVLLARERLVERLRSVSLSSTSDRQSTRSALGAPSDEPTHNDEYRLVDTRNWESGTTLAWIAGYYPYPNSFSQTNAVSSSQDFSTKRPRGLKLAELNSLHREVFTTEDKGDAIMLEHVLECSICLDRFNEGEELVCLPCEHKFHSACLYPWVRTCGDCPNCRAGVII